MKKKINKGNKEICKQKRWIWRNEERKKEYDKEIGRKGMRKRNKREQQREKIGKVKNNKDEIFHEIRQRE